MASVNKVILIGNLGADPEVRFTGSGQSVGSFRIATTDYWLDKNKQKQERTEWHRIVVWGRQAETCKEYLSKGRPVYVEGRLQTREWTDKEGNKRYTTEIVAQRVQFLGAGTGAGSGKRKEDSDHSSDSPTPGFVPDENQDVGDSDIPF